MRSISFIFKIHQPFRLRKYRFFDIGVTHNYYDDYQNAYAMRRVAEKAYLPMNAVLQDLIRLHGKDFKVSFVISGTALDQMAWYAPEVLQSFQNLAKTGQVEFLACPYSYSLAALDQPIEFDFEIKKQQDRIEKYFGKSSKVFCNTDLIYSDKIGESLSKMGYQAVLTEGAKHILGWKSPNYLYTNPKSEKLKVLLRNTNLSDDISFRFSKMDWPEWPLTTERFVEKLNVLPKEEEVVNIFMDYACLGEYQGAECGIIEFMKFLPGQILKKSDFRFAYPSEICKQYKAVSPIHIPTPVSCMDEEKDTTAWLGNELQSDAYQSLIAQDAAMDACTDTELCKDWTFLQSADHFYYMGTKWFSEASTFQYYRPYDTPYDAFINYMNVLSDFIERLKLYQEKPKKNNEIKIQKQNKMATKKTTIPKEETMKKETTKKTVAPKKAAAKKPAVKKAAAPKKAVAKKPAVKKAVAPKKAVAKKAAVKKAVAPKKAVAKKAAVKKAVAPKKAVAKKAVAKKPAVKKAVAPKKAVAKKAAVKKAVAPKKAVAKKPAVKKAVAPKKAVAKKPAVKKAVAPKKK